MNSSASAMHELKVQRPGHVPPEVLALDVPCVLRGLVAHWPLVQAAAQGAGAVAACLQSHWQGATVGVFQMARESAGRIAYTEDFSGFNFGRQILPFDQVLAQLLAWQDLAPSLPRRRPLRSLLCLTTTGRLAAPSPKSRASMCWPRTPRAWSSSTCMRPMSVSFMNG